MIVLSKEQIENLIGIEPYTRGLQYYQKGFVRKVAVSENGNNVKGLVQGSEKQPYWVSIELSNRNNSTQIEGRCACYVGYNCKHVVATLLAAIDPHSTDSIADLSKDNSVEDLLKEFSEETQTKTQLSDFDNWLQLVENNQEQETLPLETQKDEHRLVYILAISYNKKPGLSVKLWIAKKLKKGGFGNAYKSFAYSSDSHMRVLTTIDHDILHRLEVAKRISNSFYHYRVYDDEYEFVGETASTILEDIIKTGCCYWENHQDNSPLALGEPKTGDFNWSIVENGKQKLTCKIENREVQVLPITPFFYLDLKANCCGILETNFDQTAIKQLLFSPLLEPKDIPKMIRILKDRFQGVESIPFPEQYKLEALKQSIPKPKLLLFGKVVDHFHFYRLYGKAITLPLGRLSFVYEQTELAVDGPASIQQADPNTLTLKVISRNLEIEAKIIHDLFQKGVVFVAKRFPMTPPSLLSLNKLDFLIAEPDSKEGQELFLHNIIPELQRAGWEVSVEKSFPVEYVVEVDDWYTELHETNEYDWFNMEVGFVLDGEKVNILPLLLQLIERMPGQFSEKYLNSLTEESYLLPLPNGKNIQIPLERIKGILSTLTELYDSQSLSDTGFLPISYLEATQLVELEKAMAVTEMRWLGGERLRKLGEKLSNFTAIQSVAIPQAFKGQLRDYQQKGVDWLNFLREFRLGGILCDDMGLGKTVQTLAHLLIEEQENRLEKPCLIVAPTSLMENWRSEAQQFTPTLKVLVLQGEDRRKSFEDIKNSDLILTTYPLLVRDKDLLLEHHYSVVILDEAQFAKNANTKAYQILQQFKTEHRLCLTGTPMENHLGELWSLFNFLSPGFLGKSAQFSKIFRTPIEKHGNVLRRNNLNQRIKPYLLRRKKEEVTAELPAKTEITHKIALDSEQRDLYESIRLSMENKVRMAIQNKGFGGSQIIILDALLKLRQVCCDPRLLSLESAKKVSRSAKLEFLMEMLIELVDEGRKILLFSSFSSMLKLIEDELKKEKLNYVKLTGSTTDRITPIQQFQTTDVPIFLISLKAGGTGLNLTAADTVIHYDPWWNPAAEAQATDRAHRIGQTKPVFVYKLITSGTVEEKILLMQEKKRALLDSLFEDTVGEKVGTISPADLQFLFQSIESLET